MPLPRTGRRIIVQHKPTSMQAPYVAVYRLNVPGPIDDAELAGVALKTGPFELHRSVPIVQFVAGGVATTMGVQSVPFGPGIYMLTVQQLDFDIPDRRAQAALASAEQAAMIDLAFPHLIAEKQFEGVVNAPGTFVFAPEGPVTFTARPFEGVSALLSGIQAADGRLRVIRVEDRERFRLAARWFRRGCETINSIDKMLFWFIALEVYPAVGDADVPKFVRNLIHSRIYPKLEPGIVKDRIGIGPIAGLRARIVHDGLSSVPESERDAFHHRLSQLNALVRTCLKILAGVQPGNDLDEWVMIPPAKQ
jgi:hypothetical protein